MGDFIKSETKNDCETSVKNLIVSHYSTLFQNTLKHNSLLGGDYLEPKLLLHPIEKFINFNSFIRYQFV